MTGTIRINRAPVLTLWAAIVAERFGFDRDAALTLGRAVSSLNATRKPASRKDADATMVAVGGDRLATTRQSEPVALLGFFVPVLMTADGWRAVSDGQPISPQAVETHLRRKFGHRLGDARAAMTGLATSMPVEELTRRAFGLYEQFRPNPPAGTRRLGVPGDLDLARLQALTHIPSRSDQEVP